MEALLPSALLACLVMLLAALLPPSIDVGQSGLAVTAIPNKCWTLTFAGAGTQAARFVFLR